MAGFFPHVGTYQAGYTSLPSSTQATILDNIVADVGAGVNNWTVWDDQRSAATPLVVNANQGWLNVNNTYGQFTFTNGSSTFSQTNCRFPRDVNLGVTQISMDQTNWYTINTVNNGGSAGLGASLSLTGVLDRNFTGTSTTTGRPFVKMPKYVVLKCTSTQKTFYVLIGQVGYGDPVRLQVFETWDATAHTGTNPGPQETMRAYNWYGPGTRRIQYILWLLPDAFALWTSGLPGEIANGANQPTGANFLANGVAIPWADFFYAGNLSPYRSGDNTCLVQACTNQELSGIYVTQGVYNSTLAAMCDSFNGGAPMMYALNGSKWRDPAPGIVSTFPGHNVYSLWPRGPAYFYGPDRTTLDEAGKMQYCEVDAYQVGQVNNGLYVSEGRRGEVRYLKYPIHNPSGQNLISYGASDDGNVYICVRTTYPFVYGNYTGLRDTTDTTNADVANYNALSGFAHTNRNGNFGELLCAPSYLNVRIPRFFLMPINI